MPLILRSSKGSALTHSEMDGNWTFLNNLVNAVRALFNLAFNTDGTLKPNTVATASIQDRAVTVNKRAFLSSFYYTATGSGDALVIANAPGLTLSAYAAGISLLVKAPSANTGPATLQVDALVARAIKKLDGQDLNAGDISNGGVIHVVDTGAYFVLIGAGPAAPAPPNFIQTLAAQALPAGFGTLSFPHGLGQKPKYVSPVLVCMAAELGYSIDDEVPLDAVGYSVAATGQVSYVWDLDDIKIIISNNNPLAVADRTGPDQYVAIDRTKWKAKIYCSI